jgi:hypothetical protein
VAEGGVADAIRLSHPLSAGRQVPTDRCRVAASWTGALGSQDTRAGGRQAGQERMQIQLWSRVFLTRFLTETSRDGAGGQGFREPVKTIGAGEMRRIGCIGNPRAVALCAHNPEVAGSNPAPATNVVAGQRPFPNGRGPLACVARDQIRDQTCDQRRLSRPAASPAKRRFEICATCCDGSGHLRRGRRV